MNIFRYILLSLAASLAGAVVGCFSGLALGWLLAFGYHKRGPSDPADAPAMLAVGLMLLGACIGAVIGFVVGIILCVRIARGSSSIQPTLPH
jgi:NhaP-type Na+/H+ or K+/H+ antiporter